MKKLLTQSLFLMLYVLAGCGEEGENRPPVDGGVDTHVAADTGPSETGVDTFVPPNDTGVDLGTPDAGNPCFGAGGCFTSACTPAEASPSDPDDWFLDHCNAGYCAPFDNATRIPNYVGDP